MRKTFKPFLALALFAILVLSSCFGHSHNFVLVEETKASCTQDGVIAHYECECGKYFDLDHNEITNIVSPKLGHNLTHHAAKDATCTESGNVEYWHCERCGKNFSDQAGTKEITNVVVAAKGHNYELIATWDNSGECTYYLQCKNNNTHKVENLEGVITHTDDNATCTSKGSVVYTLTVTYDGKIYTSNYTLETAMKEHDWRWVIDVEATETTDGVKHEVCNNCGEIRNEGTVIPHTHTHELTPVNGQAATETEAGFKSYYSCECGKYFEDAEGSIEIADLAAWKAEGGRGYLAPTGAAPHQHSFTTVAKVDATETTAGHEAYYVCSSCGKAYTSQDDESTLIEDLTAWLAEGGAGYIAPVPHQHDLALVPMSPATEITAGYKAYYTCSCGKYFEDAQGEVEISNLAAWKAEGGRGYIAPTGVAPHQHELTLVQGKEATTTEAGYKSYYECSCGKYFEDEAATKEITDLDAWKSEGGAGYLPVVVAPHTHEYTKVEAKAASCTEDGNIEYYTCNVEGCGKLFTKSGEEYTEVTAADVVIPATGHSYGKWSVVTLPSANAEGLATRECGVCHDVDELALPVVNEENYNAVIKTPATCASKGVHTYTLKTNDSISFDLEDIEVSNEHGELQDAATSTEFVFTSKSWDDSTNSWTSNEDGNSFEVANSARGVQCTATAGATSKDVFKKVTKIVVVCSSNGSSGAENKIIIKIGDSTIEVAAAGSYTNTEKVFEFVSVSGQIELIVNRSGSKSVYIKSIEIFYTAEVRSLTKHEGTEPSCEIDGEKTYYECPICHKFFEDEKGTKEIDDIDTWKVIPALGHDYDTPTYEWKDGFCTATKVCKTDTSHVVTEQVTAVYVKDTNATCTENEKGHLVATFETEGFETQSTEANSYVVENSALGHDYPNVASRYLFENDKWYAEYDCSRCGDVKKEETTDVKVAINNVGFATLQAAIDSTEVGDIRKVSETQITESIKLSRDVKFVSLNYNGDFDFNGHKLLLEGEVDKLTLKVSASVSDQEINDNITVVGKKIVINRAGEIATVTFELDGQAVTIHKDGTHTAYQTLDEAIAAFDGALDEVIKLNAPLTANGSITITNSAVLDFETHDVTATSLVINDGVVFTVFNGRFLGSIDENDLMTGKLVIKAGYHAHVIEGGFDIHLLSLIHHDAVAATCEDDGNVEYWECDRCHDKFADEDCTQEITDVVIPAKGHNFGTPTYVWNDGECTASKVCTNGDSFVVIETVIGEYVKDTDATCEENEKGHLVATFKNEGFEAQSTEANSYVVENTALGHDWQPVNITWDGEDKFTAHANFICSHDASHTKQEVATVTDDGKAANWYQEVTKTYTASFEGFESITKTEVLAKIPLVKASTIDSATNTIIYVIGTVSEEVNQYGTVYLGEFQLYSFGSAANGIDVGDIVVASGKVYDYVKNNNHTYEFKKDNTYHGNIEAVLKLHAKVSQTCTESGVRAYYTWNDLYFDIDDELNVTFIGDTEAFNVWKSDGGAGYIPADGHLFGKSEAAEDVIWDYTDVNKPVLQVRFECSTCGEKSGFVTVYTESDSNYDSENGVIVVNGRTYTATVHFEGFAYQYEVTRLKTAEEVIAEVDANIDAINKSLYSDYALPTSITVDAVDSLLQSTELTYSWTFEDAPATVITYTSPEQATELTYHLCVKNGEEVLVADKEVVFTLVSYSSLNTFTFDANGKDFVAKLVKGNDVEDIPDNFRLVPNHAYTIKLVSSTVNVKDFSLKDSDNANVEITYLDPTGTDIRTFSFVAPGKDVTLKIVETCRFYAIVSAEHVTIKDSNDHIVDDDYSYAAGSNISFIITPEAGYRLESVDVVGQTDTDEDLDEIVCVAVAEFMYITITTVKTQTVTFNKNFVVDPATIEVVVDQNQKVSAPEVVRTGYTLTGWQTVGGDDFDFDTEITDDITLNAVWEVNKYNVTFDVNGGVELSEEDKVKEVTYDAKYGTLPTSTRTYYTFAGWFTAQNDGDEVTADSDVKITENQTLYAHWTKVQYALNLTINNSRIDGQPMGGVAVDDDTELAIEGIVTFTFTYHSPSVNGNVVKVKSLTIGTDEKNYASEIENDELLFEFADKHIDLDNSKIDVVVEFVEYEVTVGSVVNGSVTINTNNKTGKDNHNNDYSLDWDGTTSTDSSRIGSGKSPADWIEFVVTLDNSYIIKTISLIAAGNGSGQGGRIRLFVGDSQGECVKTQTISGTSSATISAINVNKRSNKITFYVDETTGGVKDMTFSYSYDTSMETEVSYYNVSVAKLGKGSISGITFAGNENTFNGVITTKELTFTPATGYSVESVLFGETPVVLVDGKYTFDLSSDENVTNVINVTFSRNDYTITYNGIDGASFASANPAKYNVETETFTLVNPTKTGYTFTGWTYDGQNEPTTDVSVTVGSTGDKAFTANWQIINYDIVYNGVEGATFASANPAKYNVETETFTLVNPTKAGYTFTGWTFEGQTTPSTEVSVTLGSTGEKSFTANFTANDDTAYQVKHYQQNIDDDDYTLVTDDTENKAGTTATDTEASANSYTGFTAKVFEQKKISGDGLTVVEIYYDRDTFTVTLHLVENDATLTSTGWTTENGVSTQTFRYGKELTLPSPASATKSFVKWADAETDGNDVTGTLTITSNVEVWARWSTARIVRFDGNTTDAVTGLPGNAEVENGNSYSIPDATPTRVGYTFVGWNTDKDATEFSYKYGVDGKDSLTIDNDTTLYAIWTINSYTVTFVSSNDAYGTVEAMSGELTVQLPYGTVFEVDDNDISTDNDIYTATATATTAQYTYTFTGWSIENGYVLGADNLTITATFTRTVSKYTVTLAVNNADYGTITGYSAAFEVDYNTLITVDGTKLTINGTDYTAIANEADTKYTYGFDSWNKENGDAITANVTITSTFTATGKTYTVTFDKNGADGEQEMTQVSVTYGEAPKALTANTYTNTGMEFKGWNTKADGTGTDYANEAEISNLEADLTLYAKWEEEQQNFVYSLYTGELVEGDYIIVYEGKALNTTKASNRLQYESVSPENNSITNPDSSIIWHISASGNYWLLYNESENVYAASTNSKNQASTSETITNNTKWTVHSDNGTYDFENLSRSGASKDSANKWLRCNGDYGFACYASGTGGALSLYKLSSN